ncbi:hypothetical protein GBA52_015178 [Prunus armeniaca]|nr:hypothetical protein GBA52_015178 [Prunus armeniaca]
MTTAMKFGIGVHVRAMGHNIEGNGLNEGVHFMMLTPTPVYSMSDSHRRYIQVRVIEFLARQQVTCYNVSYGRTPNRLEPSPFQPIVASIMPEIAHHDYKISELRRAMAHC